MTVITVLKDAVGINKGYWLHYSEVQVEPYEYTTPKNKMTTGKLHYITCERLDESGRFLRSEVPWGVSVGLGCAIRKIADLLCIVDVLA